MTSVPATSSNELPPARNRRATASVVVGLLGVLAMPLAVVTSRYFEEITLVQACASAVVAAVLGIVALAQAKRGRATAQLTLGRSGGEGAARAGRWLGMIAIWIGATTGLALAFYAVLAYFAD